MEFLEFLLSNNVDDIISAPSFYEPIKLLDSVRSIEYIHIQGIDNCECKIWFKDRYVHREDGPAIECGNNFIWVKNGFMHKEDGPAYISKYRKKWFQNGKYHRVDGPAIEDISLNTLEWWYKGTRVFCKDQEHFEKLLKLKSFW